MTATMQTDAVMAFSAAIRSASADAHRSAQGSTFVRELLGGGLPVAGYAKLAAQHYFIYSSLEAAAAAMSTVPEAAPFVRDELKRVPALESDLAFLLGDNWRSTITPTPATAAYCNRINEVCTSWAGGFVAHHYVRYMGDLSGGQHIGEIVRRNYNLNGSGARFYAFEDIADPSTFKQTYREQLDAAPWDANEQARIIDEILLAYEFNTSVLEGLA